MIIGFDGQLKLTDFGISRAGASEITQTGTVLGTAEYWRPSRPRASPQRSDGPLLDRMILYELLTGRVPFEGETVVAILLQHVKERPIPRERATAPCHRLDAIVMRALEKRPGACFADADAFIEALEDAKAALRLEDTVTATRRSGWGSFTGRGWKRPEYPPTFAEPRPTRSSPC